MNKPKKGDSQTVLFFILLIVINSSLFAQNITLKGVIQDSINTPLSFANIIADPTEDIDIAFAISDEMGRFQLNLKKGKTYRVTVSYLGFNPYFFEFTANETTTKVIQLSESKNQLEEVELTYTPPVIIREDTITYRADAFKTGEERKLRDVLKKLPAVEVDRAGNVTVQGKKVTKLLVENKQFFTGDSKLAVNNIPADAVDKIQVLDDYTDISFLKGLQESDELAMNIKLKEDKKKFMFGDATVGVGVKERYLVHTSLFYYSPKRTLNFISDFNNNGTKSFTIKDYLDFEGGINKLISDAKGYFSTINDDFSQFLNNKNFISSQNQFSALNFTQSISSKTDLSSYGIWSNVENKTRVETLNNYILSDETSEVRNKTGLKNNDFFIGKIMLQYDPNNDTNISLASYLKTAKNKSNEITQSIVEQNNTTINTQINARDKSFKQDVQWHKKFNKTHTSSAVLNYHYQKAKPRTNWLTDETILQGLIPIVDQDIYNLFKEKETKSHNTSLIFKHYSVLNRFNHIYFTLGTQLAVDDYFSNEYQRLQDNSLNNFSTSNFGNNTQLNFKDAFVGIHYKVQKGKVVFKPGLFYHYYDWSTSQFDQSATNNKTVVLPELITDVAFSSTKKIKFRYNLKVRFPNISQLANRYTLLSFNSIYQGDERLENELYHHVYLHFYRFSLFKDLHYNASVNYRLKEDNFKNTTTIQGIDFVSTPVLSDFEDKYLSIRANLKKGFSKFKIALNSSFSEATFEKPINTFIQKNSSKNYSLGAGFETRFKNFPNVELKYDKTFSKYKSNGISEFKTDIFYSKIEYDFFNDFIFNATYQFENYQNKTQRTVNTFDVLNASLFYQKENSPWGFELSANNIFDIKFKNRNSFSSVFVSDEKSFVMPRILLFKLSYKL